MAARPGATADRHLGGLVTLAPGEVAGGCAIVVAVVLAQQPARPGPGRATLDPG